MKRSEINSSIRRAIQLCHTYSIALPPFAHFDPDTWLEKGKEYDEIRECMLGWDITDYGLGQFQTLGLTLITLRNGKRSSAIYTKPYAEKLLISEENQVCPMHFHWFKSEDIINRNGGILMMQLYTANSHDELSHETVQVQQDGRRYQVNAGAILELSPGESITLPPRMYHAFWAKPKHGPVLIGEVSLCNDDHNDNRFLEPIGRFPIIEEDEPAFRMLCTEYPPVKKL
jgi:hypothetical protein